MCGVSTSSQASAVGAGTAPGDDKVEADGFGIGELFRAYGEAYIDAYRPDLRTLHLIRAIRVCHTPALGGHLLKCPDCGTSRYRYFSCGHGHCPLCQGNKRRAWYEREQDRLFKVPYLHITFTLPHELNGLCRLHPGIMYNLLFGSAWKTLRQLCRQTEHLGGLVGMTSVLHTWGADLKHHVHVHCLVTFGGLNEKSGQWVWPRRKEKLLRHRPLRNGFRANFLSSLKKWMKAGKEPVYHQSYEVLTADLHTKTWVVNQQPPTLDAEVINAYLSRYICRIGISDKRLRYDPISGEVTLQFKDYRRQQVGQAAPQASRKLNPLLAMEKILQHVLPPYFHRTRHYGLHAPLTRRRLKNQLEPYLKKAPDTVVMIFRLLKAMLQLSMAQACPHCGSLAAPEETEVAPDREFIQPYLGAPKRAPPWPHIATPPLNITDSELFTA